MAIQKWSDNITVVELGEDPQFTEDMLTLMDGLAEKSSDVVLNFSTVGFVNSSDISKLLRLRKVLINARRRLILCGVGAQVWGVFLVTGLDKIFEFINDIPTALATLQMAQQKS